MSSFALKVLALICMLIEHIGGFIPNTPIYFHWIGRISAPIFIFCCIQGFIHTKSKTKYLIHLYIASLIMSIIQYGTGVENNFFRTLFSLCIIIHLIETYKNKDIQFKSYIRMYLLWQVSSILLVIYLIDQWWVDSSFVVSIIPAFLGNVFFLEGGLNFVFLGVLIYLFKDNKKSLIISYSIFCLSYFLINTTSILPIILGFISSIGLGFISDVIEYTFDVIIGLPLMYMNGGSIFTVNYTWMTIFALPFMLSYNGLRGKNMKYFFYVFYPSHILILYYLGKFLTST